MTSREVTGVALKCLAIYLLFIGIIAIPGGVITYNRFIQTARGTVSGLNWAVLVALGSCVVIAIFGLLAWRVGTSLLRTVRDTPTDELRCEISPLDLEGMLFRVLGIYFIVSSLKPFLYNLIGFQLFDYKGNAFTIQVIEEVALLATIVLGMFIVAKPRAWVRLLGKLSRPEPEPEVEEVSSGPSPSESPDKP